MLMLFFAVCVCADAVLSGAGHFSSVVSVEPVLVGVEPGFRGPLLADQEGNTKYTSSIYTFLKGPLM